MGSSGRQVLLVATSPAQRATRRARPVVLLLAVLVAVVALALLLLPTGPALSWTMAAALVALTGLVVTLSRSKNALQTASLALRAVIGAELFVIGGSAIHYFTSLLLAPLLDAPVMPPGTLLWAVLTGIPVAVFLAWATSPIKPRPPHRP